MSDFNEIAKIPCFVLLLLFLWILIELVKNFT